MRSLSLALLLIPRCLAQTYTLIDTYSGSDFFNQFNFFTGADPTDGFVNYVDYSDAVSYGLIPDTSVAKWGVDSYTTLDASTASGRTSIRMTSTATYTHGLFIADIAHMPGSICGIWPSYWFFGQNGVWPNSGEIDVIEGVNNGATNLISGHTKVGCTVTGSDQTATLETSNCSVPSGAVGCSNSDPRTDSFGTGFNNIGGGVYAMDWTSDYIQVWFFPRSAIPASITSGNPNPAADFGTPTANFQGDCDIDNMFYDMAIVFDTDFCGNWAGAVYESMSCPVYSGETSLQSCNTYVAQNPGVYNEAYWEVNYIKVYSN